MKIPSNCKYKLYIDCIGVQNCKKCGWNPEVEEKRKKKLRKAFKKKSDKWIVGEKKGNANEAKK